uniref:Uncharacterized protein n=1 Tax=Anopheles atroparvus TaxID=41427 RepID=A0A182JHP9_ANOAO
MSTHFSNETIPEESTTEAEPPGDENAEEKIALTSLQRKELARQNVIKCFPAGRDSQRHGINPRFKSAVGPSNLETIPIRMARGSSTFSVLLAERSRASAVPIAIARSRPREAHAVAMNGGALGKRMASVEMRASCRKVVLKPSN